MLKKNRNNNKIKRKKKRRRKKKDVSSSLSPVVAFVDWTSPVSVLLPLYSRNSLSNAYYRNDQTNSKRQHQPAKNRCMF